VGLTGLSTELAIAASDDGVARRPARFDAIDDVARYFVALVVDRQPPQPVSLSGVSQTLIRAAAAFWNLGELILSLCVPKTSSTSCDQAIFVDQSTDSRLFSDAPLSQIDRFG
jgi:hypothetical protein